MFDNGGSEKAYERIKAKGYVLFAGDTPIKMAFIHGLSPLAEVALKADGLEYMTIERMWGIANSVYCCYMAQNSRHRSYNDKVIEALSISAMSVFKKQDWDKAAKNCIHQMECAEAGVSEEFTRRQAEKNNEPDDRVEEGMDNKVPASCESTIDDESAFFHEMEGIGNDQFPFDDD